AFELRRDLGLDLRDETPALAPVPHPGLRGTCLQAPVATDETRKTIGRQDRAPVAEGRVKADAQAGARPGERRRLVERLAPRDEARGGDDAAIESEGDRPGHTAGHAEVIGHDDEPPGFHLSCRAARTGSDRALPGHPTQSKA